MAYNTEDLLSKALKAIKNENHWFKSDVIASLPCGKTAFYDHFPPGSDEVQQIEDLLEVNRIREKQKLRKKFLESDTPALLIAAMKLLATDDERKRLSQSFHEVATGDPVEVPKIVFKKIERG